MSDEQQSASDSSFTLADFDRRRFLRRTAGAAAAVAAVPTLSGFAAAHYLSELNIDVQPDNEDNVIDLDEDETVSVAVLPVEFLSEGERTTFDPTERDVRYRLGPWSASEDGEEGARPVDDGEIMSMGTGHGEDAERQDVLILEFSVAETGLDNEDEVTWLFWDRDESREHGLAGFDSTRVIGGEPSAGDLFDLLERLVSSMRG
jgi:hypothetical protein